MIIVYSLICNTRFALLIAEYVKTRRFCSTITSEMVVIINYVNKEMHSDRNILISVIVKNIICNNPNRDCNNFFTTITKLFMYFSRFYKNREIYVFYNNFTYIYTYIYNYSSVYKICKLNVTNIQGVPKKR